MRAQGIILENPNYVKRVIFPLEMLPLSILLANVIQAGIALLVLMVVILIAGFSIPLTALAAACGLGAAGADYAWLGDDRRLSGGVRP